MILLALPSCIGSTSYPSGPVDCFPEQTIHQVKELGAFLVKGSRSSAGQCITAKMNDCTAAPFGLGLAHARITGCAGSHQIKSRFSMMSFFRCNVLSEKILLIPLETKIFFKNLMNHDASMMIISWQLSKHYTYMYSTIVLQYMYTGYTLGCRHLSLFTCQC